MHYHTIKAALCHINLPSKNHSKKYFQGVLTYCRTGNFRDRKFSRIPARDNSRAGNSRKILVSRGPQLENEPLFVKFGQLLREIWSKTESKVITKSFPGLQYAYDGLYALCVKPFKGMSISLGSLGDGLLAQGANNNVTPHESIKPLQSYDAKQLIFLHVESTLHAY